MPGVGTSFLEGRIVRGECERCASRDVLVYSLWDEDTLCCADCTRRHAVTRGKPPQECDSCGAVGNVWRDPITRKNEMLCVNCHDPEALFQNRWANKARESVPLGVREKVKCVLEGYGTGCAGEIKWRTVKGVEGTICNKHAGKQSIAQEYHQL